MSSNSQIADFRITSNSGNTALNSQVTDFTITSKSNFASNPQTLARKR